MIAVGLLVVLTLVAIPSFRTLILSNRMTNAVNGMIYALQAARSEAVKISGDVTVCRRNGDWKNGWLVYTGDDCTKSSAERLVLEAGTQEGMVKVNAGFTSLTFRRNGQSTVAGALTFCDGRGGDHAKAVAVSATGRIHSSDKKADGDPLDCS